MNTNIDISQEEFDIIEQYILKACHLTEINLLDHLIISREHSFSFAEHNLIAT